MSLSCVGTWKAPTVPHVKRVIVFTDHAAPYFLLIIDEPSGRLIRWIFRLAEFYFEDKYKKGKINNAIGPLFRLNTTSETISHDKKDDIPVLELKRIKVELKLNKRQDEVDFIDVQYTEVDELYETIDDPAPSHTIFEPIRVDERLKAQLHHQLCAKIRRKLNEEGVGI